MKFSTPAACALFLLAAACLENEEEFEIRRDGSVTVRLKARGQVDDMAGGYPIPLDAPWQPIADDNRLWTSVIGPDTGSVGVQERVGEGLWAAHVDDPERSVVLAVEGHFASVADVPRLFAPSTEPYREAYLERSAHLTIEHKSGRTVYVFERRFHSRDKGLDTVDERARAGLSEELQVKLDEGGPFSPADKVAVCSVYRDVLLDTLDQGLRIALSSLYTVGDGSVPLSTVLRAVERTADELRSIVELERMVRAWNELERVDQLRQQGVEIEIENPLDALEQEVRDALRRGVRSLSEDGVESSIVNGLLFRIESLFTKDDHTSDLGDEKFKVSVVMPGVVLAGNYGALDGSRATFEFEGRSLANRDVVLRVVSVEE